MLLVLVLTLFAFLLSPVTADVLKHNESTQLKVATPTKHQLHRNLTLAATNASLTNNKKEITPTPWWQLPIQTPFWQLPLQFVVSGVVAGLALYFANVRLDKRREPKLSVDKAKSPKVVRIELAVYKIDEKRIPYHLRHFTVLYNVNRILIRNEGKSAAKKL